MHPTSSHRAEVADNAAENQGPLADIIVTATRHEESLSKVPISVTRLTQDTMDIKGIKDIDDVARFTPGVTVDTSGTNHISIRGIASSGGAGTTGIYIDDTPIQIRALAFNPDDALPKSSISTVSRCCADRRERFSAQAPKAVPSATSRRNPA